MAQHVPILAQNVPSPKWPKVSPIWSQLLPNKGQQLHACWGEFREKPSPTKRKIVDLAGWVRYNKRVAVDWDSDACAGFCMDPSIFEGLAPTLNPRAADYTVCLGGCSNPKRPINASETTISAQDHDPKGLGGRVAWNHHQGPDSAPAKCKQSVPLPSASATPQNQRLRIITSVTLPKIWRSKNSAICVTFWLTCKLGLQGHWYSNHRRDTSPTM